MKLYVFLGHSLAVDYFVDSVHPLEQAFAGINAVWKWTRREPSAGLKLMMALAWMLCESSAVGDENYCGWGSLNEPSYGWGREPQSGMKLIIHVIWLEHGSPGNRTQSIWMQR